MKNLIALRFFLMGIAVMILTTVPIFLNKAYASTMLFQDDFESGNASKWTPLDGTQGIWQVKDVNGSKMYGARVITGSTIIQTVAGDPNWTDYQFEMDMYPIMGTDRNIGIRWNPSQNRFCNEFHFTSDGVMLDGVTSVGYTLINGVPHHIKVTLQSQHYQLFVDSEKIIDAIDSNSQCLSGSMGLRIGTGADYPTEVWFDNIVVSTLDDSPTPTPTPSPSPTPTATPTVTPMPTSTPIPIQINLNVPTLRQTDKPWSTQTYDGANFWSPLAKAIKNWGCALTSYTMVLKYFGINKLPNGVNLDPGTLNNWLKDNHGYIDGKTSGYVNPLAISSLSKKAVKINNITSFDALEYSRISDTNNAILANEINNNRPAVLEEPGHFIVAKGINGNTFNIIDPYYANRTDLTAYDNTFNSLNELKPSKTDLSYILITGNENLNMQVKDSAGNNLGEQFDQQPLVNPENDESAGEPIKMDLFQKPQSGNYTLELGSGKSGAYDVSIYSYDINGNVNIEDVPVVSHVEKTDTIDLSFDNQNSKNSKVKKEVTFDSLIDDINDLNSLHLIGNKFSEELIDSIKRIQKHYDKRFKWFAELELRFIDRMLFFHDRRQLAQKAYAVISEDIEDLIKGL